MAPRDRSSSGGILVTALVALLILALGAGLAFVLSELNHRRFRLATEQGWIVVERGRRLPWGFSRFEPEAPELVEAYAPIAIPTGESIGRSEVF